jgi:hypothetical protein
MKDLKTTIIEIVNTENTESIAKNVAQLVKGKLTVKGNSHIITDIKNSSLFKNMTEYTLIRKIEFLPVKSYTEMILTMDHIEHGRNMQVDYKVKTKDDVLRVFSDLS